LRLIQARWPAIRAKLQAQLMTADRLRELLAAAGCPTDPAAIGVDLGRLRELLAGAHDPQPLHCTRSGNRDWPAG
jgi:hypothetical protein